MRKHAVERLRRVTCLSAVMTALTGFIFTGVAAAYATGTYGSASYGECDYGMACSISLISNGTISLNVTPASGGRCTIQSDSAAVETDDSNGYTLTLASSSTNTSLVNGGSSIAASSGTVASPAALAANKWGYRVDGLGSFGAGPTTAQSNIAVPSTTFAAIKASNVTADTIASTSSAANPAVTTTVWYGACADTSQASGTYTTQVTYTAVAN
jgi:hypothetical protein